MRFNKFLIGFAIILASVAMLGAVRAQDLPARPAGGKKPNILVIMGDDVGWMNVSAYGGDIMGVRTPMMSPP